MTIYSNSGLKLNMESAKGADIVISAITAAAPGVFTSTAHGLLANDVVLITSNISQLNGRVFAVSNITANSFSLLDIAGGTNYVSTVGMDAFINCTVNKITFGTTITGTKDFSAKGGDIKTVDTTTVQDKKDQQIVVGATALSYDMTMLWDPADAGQSAMINAFNAGTSKAFKITWPNGRYALFAGSIGYAGAPGGASQGVTTSPATIALSGTPSYAI